MSNEVSIPQANPNLNAQGAFQFMNRPMESQYYESEYSVFGNQYNGPLGTAPANFGALSTPMFPIAGNGTSVGTGVASGMMGMGMGMFGFGGMYGNVDQYVENAKKWNNGYHDIMDNNSDRSSETEMKNQSNRNIVNGLADSLTYDLSRMKDNITNNDMRQACDNYDNLYKLIAKREGVEIKYHKGRIIKDEHINAQIAKCYKEVTGSDLMGDISTYGDSNFENGFKRVSVYGYEQGSADEIKAYMTGDRLQDKNSRKLAKFVGGGSVVAIPGALLGGGIGLFASAAKGAKAGKSAGGAKGAIVGAIIGGIAGLIGGGLLANSSPDKKNMEKVSNY